MAEFRLPFTGSYPITLDYGGQIPSQFGGGTQRAIDYGTPAGTPILASGTGVVKSLGWNTGGGNVAIIEHGSGISTIYGHLSKFTVSEGQKVSAGEQIGVSGNTGAYTTGPHLLFGAKSGSQNIDPKSLIGTSSGGGFSGKTDSSKSEEDQGLFGIPGAIGDAAFSFGFIFLGAIILLAGVLIMRK